MEGARLQDRIARGMGLAAKKLGGPYIVYRPNSSIQPIVERNRVVRLCASLEPVSRELAAGLAGVSWVGVFDSIYTKVGDYLVGEKDTFFVATQIALRPVQCILTNSRVDVVRPSFAKQGQYSGLFASNGEALIGGWPAHIASTGGPSGSVRVGGSDQGNWTMLLPSLPISLKTADVVSDESGSTYVIEVAENGLSGWRLLMKRIGQ